MDSLVQDIRFGVKLLRKEKGFTAAVLLTLALCIGANAAIFSVVSSVVLRPLPFPHPERLVKLLNSYPNAGGPRGGAGVPDYDDRRREIAAFDAVALYRGGGVTIGESGSPERVSALHVTPSLFRVLGVRPVRGRAFTEEDGQVGGEHKVVLSYALWQQRFAGRDVLGTDIRVNGQPYTVVGILPRGFTFEDPDARLWLPLAFTAADRADDRRHSNNYQMIARLRPYATLQQAQQQVDALNRRNDERFPAFREILRAAGFHTIVAGYRNDLIRDVSATLYLLQLGVLLVLLIGCVNVANLVLVRSTARVRELATRSALGAPHRRLVRQLLTENVLLATAGGGLGLLGGWAGVRAFRALGADQLPRGTEIHMDAAVVLGTLALSVVSGLVFGAIPVARLRANRLAAILREEGRSGTAARSAVALRGALVAGQVGLASALLVGAGLLITSFVRTLGVDPGFRTDHVLTAAVSLPVTRYPDEAARRQFAQRAVERVRAIPGVVAAGATDYIPFGNDENGSVMTPEAYAPQPGESPLAPLWSLVTPGMLEAIRLPLARGRQFRESDDAAGAPRVALIDQWLAKRYWPGQDPIGRRLFQGVYGMMPDSEIQYYTIVGVVKDSRFEKLTGEMAPGHVYVANGSDPSAHLYFTLRTAGDPLAGAGTLRSRIAAIDPDLPVYDVKTMEERVSASLTLARASMVLLAGFGSLALFLAAVGIYGVLAYSVAQRTGEFGIRVALGGTARDIFGLVLGQGARMLGVGLLVGVAGSLALTRFLRGMLYGVSATDPLVFGAAIALLTAVTAAACLVPARRATRISPVDALRG